MSPERARAGVSSEPCTTVEAVVVGTGFGGAVAACRLAQAGYKPTILERGRRYEADDFPPLPNDSQFLPDLRQWTWQSEQGIWDIVDLHEIISVQVAGYGGGSLLYGNVHLRPPESVFDGRWPDEYRNGQLEPFYDLVAYMLDAAPIDEHAELGRSLVKVDQLRQATRKLGRKSGFFLPPLTINRRNGIRFGRQQNACNGCGGCCSGCRERAKNTLDQNYLAIAEDHGATVRTQCEVVDIEQGDGTDETWTVRCVDHLRGQMCCFVTPYLFLCAGSIHSTRLLARATLRADRHRVKERVGVGYFPGGDAVGLVFDAEHAQHPSVGPVITTSTVHWNPDKRDSFFVIQDGGYAEQLERMIGVLRAPLWLGRNRLTRKQAGPSAATHATKQGLTVPLASRPSGTKMSALAVLPSPADAVLDALARGDGADMLPPQLRNSLAGFLSEVRDATLLPAIVDKTIDGALRQRMREIVGRFWLGRWIERLFPDESRLMHRLRRFARWLIRKSVGTDTELADRALRALLTRADLPRREVGKRMLGYDATQPTHRAMLLAMGRDAAHGQLHYDAEHDRLIADLDLFALGPGYTQQEQLMMDLANALGGELRTSPAWAFLGKPITVHNQGGCPMSTHPEHGVTDPNGRVHGCPGLYVLDGAALCTSVGVNPAPTIAAIAERNILQFIESNRSRKRPAETWTEYRTQRRQAEEWKARALEKGWQLRPPDAKRAPPQPFKSEPLGIRLRESLHGYYFETGSEPTSEAEYRALESRGRPKNPVRLDLGLSIKDLATFLEDPWHRAEVVGHVRCRLPGDAQTDDHPIQGRLFLLAPPSKEYAIPRAQPTRMAAQRRLAGHYAARAAAQPGASTSDERLMRYSLRLPEKRGWRFSGYKRVRNDPGLDAWRDTTSLFVKLRGPVASGPRRNVIRGGGVVHMDVTGFLFEELPSLEVTGTDDDARIVWAAAAFASFFFGSLQRIYLPQVGSVLDALLSPRWATMQRQRAPGT